MEANATQASGADDRRSSDRRKSDRRQLDGRGGGRHSKQGVSVAIMNAGFILALQFILIVIVCS